MVPANKLSENEVMKAFQVIQHIGVIPMSIERPCTVASGSEVRRWLKNKAVLINGQTPGPEDEVSFPINQLIFFPKSKRKTTVL